MFGTVSPHYQPLTLDSMSAYIYSRSELAGIFHAGEALETVEVGDGNLNLVFKVWAQTDPQRTVVLKQALPYVRLVGDSWPLPTDRARIEAQALEIQARLVPQHTPKVYFYDPEMYVIAMENLNRHLIMRKGLIQGIRYPNFAEHIGLFMARTLSMTSDLVLDYRSKKLEVARFINPELCKITEDLIFTEPYRQHERNRYHPEIEPLVLALQGDEGLRWEVAQLKEKFMTQAQSLVHGDLHTGSIMVNQTETVVIDPEFAFYGPMGFDVGAVIGNLLLNYAAQEARMADPDQRVDFRRYLTDTIIQLWQVFVREFQPVWDQADVISMPKSYQRDYMRRVLQDSVGFGAAKMLRRVIGLAGVEDIRGIEDVHGKSVAASLAMNMATALMKARHHIGHIEEVVEIAVSSRSTV